MQAVLSPSRSSNVTKRFLGSFVLLGPYFLLNLLTIKTYLLCVRQSSGQVDFICKHIYNKQVGYGINRKFNLSVCTYQDLFGLQFFTKIQTFDSVEGCSVI